jgi:hypothetical protein
MSYIGYPLVVRLVSDVSLEAQRPRRLYIYKEHAVWVISTPSEFQPHRPGDVWGQSTCALDAGLNWVGCLVRGVFQRIKRRLTYTAKV